MKPSLLIITGPTAVGKTDIVLRLAQTIPSEIINADSGQMYTPLSIGTAKPDWRNEPVPHHLFDLSNEPANFSVTDFRERVVGLITKIHDRGRLPILVGGSAFYIQSLFFPPSKNVATPISVEKGDFSWERLNEIDPERAKKIHKNDHYRIERALTLWEETGTLPSELVPVYKPLVPFHCLFLTRERDDLYQRIDQRVFQMIEEGWIEEVASLRSTSWESFLKKKKIIGYDIILEYLNKGIAESKKDELIEKIQKKTRNYAKRQMIFFKMLAKKFEEVSSQKVDLNEAKVDWVNLTLAPVDLYIKQLLQVFAFELTGQQ
jgi:tRNA dimethylallyltransferase